MPETMMIEIKGGQATCLYSDMIPLQELGEMTVERVSEIDFNHETQLWEVWPVGRWRENDKGESVARRTPLFMNKSRSVCIEWEKENYNLLLKFRV